MTRDEVNDFQYKLFDQKMLFEDPLYVIPKRAKEVEINLDFDKSKDLFESVIN